MNRLWAVLVCLFACSTVLAQSDQLLPAEQAFAFSAEPAGSDQVALTWDIAEGYYMYRNKFRATIIEGDAVIGELISPPGKKITDEFFGEQQIYMGPGPVVIHAGIDRTDASSPLTIVLEAVGQGCNKPVGVCYPPLKQTATVQLAAASTGTVTPGQSLMSLSGESGGITSLSALKNLLGAGQDQQEFLPPDEAFKMDLYAQGADQLLARFFIADGYYLYRDKVEFKSQTEGVVLAAYDLPPGIEKEDEYFGRTEVYYEGFQVDLPLKQPPRNGTSANFTVIYQGCAEKGICYPPIEKSIVLDLLPIATAQAAGPLSSSPTSTAVAGFWGFVAAAFGIGMLLTFTPCVLPLVPIMSSFIVGQGGGESRVRGGLLSVVYVLGTAVTYTAAGVLAGATGDQLQAYFQNIWFIGAVSIVLAILALSMFGLYDIQVPSAVQSRLQQKTQNMGGGKLVMVFVLGMISALIVGACVSPLLIGALGVAIVRGDPMLGGAIMFAMALGMGVFLVLLGVGMAALLPRAGRWMDYVKYGFGVVLLATAIYLLGAIPAIPVLYLWAALFIVTAVYCGALQSLPQGASGWQYLWKGVGVVLLVWGVLALLGGMSGSRDILQPVDVSSWGRGGTRTAAEHVKFVRVSNLVELDQQLEQARLQSRPAMLDYYADWCVDCIRMEKATFNDAEVARELAQFKLIQVDVTDAGDESTNAVKKRYGVYGPPAMLFFDGSGRERPDLRRYGFMTPAEFLSHIATL